MPIFQPDEEVIQRIVRVIEDVFQLGPDPTDFVELSDSIEPTIDEVATLDMESSVDGNRTVAVDATMDMESTVSADQKSAVELEADVNTTVAGDQTAAVDTMVSVNPTIDIDDMDIDMESTVSVDQTAAVDSMVSVNPTIDIDDMNIDIETTVFVDQTVPVVATMDMETTVYVDQKSAVDPAVAGDQIADVDATVAVDPPMNVASNNSSDLKNPKDFSASIEPITILNPDKLPLTFKQIRKLIVRRLFAIECNPVQNYLMVIMKRSTIDKTTRLMSGWILNHHLKYYYESMPPAVISYLLKECLTLIGDISPRVRECICSLFMQLVLKRVHMWPAIFTALTDMLDSIELNMYKGAFDVLQMIFKKFYVQDLPKNSIDILIRKLITLIGSPSSTKRSMSVSIIKELIVQKAPVLLDDVTVLMKNLLVLDNEHLKNMNDVNNKTLLRRDVCTSISTLVLNSSLLIDDNSHQILLYMIDRTKDKDDKIVKEACKYWMGISKKPDLYRKIVFPYVYDIISSLADILMDTPDKLLSIRIVKNFDEYPILTDSDSIRIHCFMAIGSMAIGLKEDILPGVVRIINRNVLDTDMKTQDAAIELLGFIADSRECREAMTPYLETPFNQLILLKNYFKTGESALRDKLLLTLIGYRDYIFHRPQYMEPMMTYLLRSEIKSPNHYPFLEREAFWCLVLDENLSKDTFRPYLTRVLSIIFNGLYNYNALEVEEYEKTNKTDHCMRNDSIDAINNLIWIYKGDILPIIMPLIDECIASDDTYSKESGILALRLIAKGDISDMVTELPKYLKFMVDTLVDYNRILSAASCLSLSRFHDMIVNRSSHDKYFIPLMEYLLTTENQYISTDPYTLSCVLYTLKCLLFDNPNAKELFAPYLTRIVTNLFKAIEYSDTDIISLQGDDIVDEYYMDSPMIICKQFKLNLKDNKDKKTPVYRCSTESCNRGKAADILYDITAIYKCRILPIIMPIIQAALKTDNWRVVECGIFAFGIINRDKYMDDAFNNDEWLPYLNEFLNCMMENLSNKRPIVRANTMVTFSRYSFNLIYKSHKSYFLPLLRMISARALDSNLNVRSTAWQVWTILKREVTDNEPELKWYMDHIWKGITDLVKSYRRLQQGHSLPLSIVQ